MVETYPAAHGFGKSEVRIRVASGVAISVFSHTRLTSARPMPVVCDKSRRFV
ncbi:MAG: hypothetical protein ACI8PT_004975 [Gammaproteobacteria bacterium]|jgi:hypothetical protein